MLPAREAAPGPRMLNAALTASTRGVARSVGSQMPCQTRRRLNANASTTGARYRHVTVTTDSFPCTARVPRRVVTVGIDPAAVQPEEAVEEHPDPDEAEKEYSEPGGQAASQGAPQPEREDENEQTGQVRGDLVVEPGALGRDRAEIADVVVGRAERLGLAEVTHDEPDDEGHRREQPADGGDTQGHGLEFFRPSASGLPMRRAPCT